LGARAGRSKADVLFFCVPVACFTSVFLSSAAADTPMITALVVDNRKTQEIDLARLALTRVGWDKPGN